MKVLVVASFVASLVTTAVAQPAQPASPAPPAPPAHLDAFLEQRVVQELAADGILLARLEVILDVEVIGGKLLVSLVDMNTGKATASTKIDAVPADREAAVALTTQVVANLAVQLGAARPQREPPRPMPTPAPAPVEDQRPRDVANERYRKEAIAKGTRGWHRGELRTSLSRTDIYDLVGRPDLAATHRSRRRTGKAALFIGGGLLISSVVLVSVASSQMELEGGCTSACEQWLIGSGFTFVAGAITAGIGLHRVLNIDVMTDAEIDQLADEHNQKLRRELGLPTASRTRGRYIHDVSWAPLVSPTGGGITVLGRF